MTGQRNSQSRLRIRIYPAAGLALLCGMLFAQPVTLPEIMESDVSFIEAVGKRRSVRAFQSKAVEMNKLSFLLRAAARACDNGRPQGKIYVTLNDRTYLYNPESHSLNQSDAALPDIQMYEAPVHILLMPDGAEISNESLWLWRGMAGQALYIGAPATGLGTVTIGGVGFPVGYPEKRISFALRDDRPADAVPEPDLLPATALSDMIGDDLPGVAGVSQNDMSRSFFWIMYGQSFWKESSGRVHRTVPSAWGKYPMAVFHADPGGLYQFDPQKETRIRIYEQDVRADCGECWGQNWMTGSPGLFIIAWNPDLQPSRDMALYEAGAMIYNGRLLAQALRIQGVWAGGADLTNQSIPGMPPGWIPLAAFGIAPVQSHTSRPSPWKDGMYTGKVTEWPEMTVEVSVRDGRMSDIKVVADFSTPGYSDKVKEMLIPEMLHKNNTDVDGITGSTMSSMHLIQAVENALKKAE